MWTTGWRLWAKPFGGFTPDWVAGLSLGNGTQQWNYSIAGGRAFVTGLVTFGSTTAISGGLIVSLPVSTALFPMNGDVYLIDASAGAGGRSLGHIRYATVNSVTIEAIDTSQPVARTLTVSSIVPHAWTVSDSLWVSFSYEAA